MPRLPQGRDRGAKTTISSTACNKPMNKPSTTYVIFVHPEHRCECGEAYRYDRQCLQCGRDHTARPARLSEPLQLAFERHVGEIYDVLIRGQRKYPADDALDRGAGEHARHLMAHARRIGNVSLPIDEELDEMRSIAARAILMLSARAKEAGR